MAGGPRVGFLERYGAVLVLVVGGTVALAIVLARGGVDPSQIGRAYVLSVGAIVIAALLLALRRASVSREPLSTAASGANPRLPPDLEKLQDSLRASRVSRKQYQREIVPLLREIAADRLLLVGISMTSEPARAADVLGMALSLQLQDDLAEGGLPLGRGPARAEVDALLDHLEDLRA